MFALYFKTTPARLWSAFPRLPSDADEQGEQIFATTDGIAERVRKNGGTKIRSTGHLGNRRSPQLLVQKFARPPVGERRRRGVVVRPIVPGEGVTLTRIAVNGRIRLFCERRFDLSLRRL